MGRYNKCSPLPFLLTHSLFVDRVYNVADVDGDFLGFMNPSLTLFSADEEAVTSCDVTSEMMLTDDDVVDVTLLGDDDELRIKSEPVEMYDDTAATMTAAQSGERLYSDTALLQLNPRSACELCFLKHTMLISFRNSCEEHTHCTVLTALYIYLGFLGSVLSTEDVYGSEGTMPA